MTREEHAIALLSESWYGKQEKGKIKDIPPEEERPGSLIRVSFSQKTTLTIEKVRKNE